MKLLRSGTRLKGPEGRQGRAETKLRGKKSDTKGAFKPKGKWAAEMTD